MCSLSGFLRKHLNTHKEGVIISELHTSSQPKSIDYKQFCTMNKLLTQYILLTSILLTTSCSNTEEQSKKADNYIDKGLYKKALPILDEMIADDSENIDALLDHGFCNLMLGRSEQAAHDYSEVLLLDRRNLLALYGRSQAYSEMNLLNPALRDLSNAIFTKGGGFVWVDEEKNTQPEAYDISLEDLVLERGIIHYELNHLDRAASDLNYCIERNVAPEEAYYYRGLIYLSYDEKEKGCVDLEKARSFGNTDADTIIQQYCK
jgi:tetratricopeptide (TPR) repeat protein